MTVRAWLFDADGADSEYDLDAKGLADGDDRRLVWVDADRDPDDLETLLRRIPLSDDLTERIRRPRDRPGLHQYPDRIHLSIRSVEQGTDPTMVDIVAGRDWVVTVHDGPLPAIQRILDGIDGETRLGALDAGGFLAAIVDSIITGYFDVIDGLGQDIDQLDEMALDRRPADDVLAAIVKMRQRIGRLRRTLAPHREAFAVLERPDMTLHEELGRPWPGLLDRFESALVGVDGLRDSLLGTFDIYMGRAVQRDSEAMRILTIVSAVLLPGVVLAGLMGMNFDLPIFDDPNNAYLVVAAMLALAAVILLVAKRRSWI